MKESKKYPNRVDQNAAGVYAGPPIDAQSLSRTQIKPESVEFTDVYGGPEMMGFRPAPDEEPEIAAEPETAGEAAAESGPETEAAAVLEPETETAEKLENETETGTAAETETKPEIVYPRTNPPVGVLTYAGPAFYNRNNGGGFIGMMNIVSMQQNTVVSNNENVPKKGDKFCRACGAALLPNAKFCIECGAGVEA